MAAVERQQRQEVEQRERERDEPEHPEVVLGPALDRVGRRLRDADRARDVLAALACHEPAEREHDLLRDDSRHFERPPHRLDRPETRPLEREPEPVGVVDRRGPRWPQLDCLTAADDGHAERPALGARDPVRDVVGRDRLAVDRDDSVPGPQSHLRGGRVGDDRRHRPRGLPASRHEQEREEHDREDDVRAGPGGDRDEALPGRGLPVRVRAERVAQLREALVQRSGRAGRELLLARRPARARRAPRPPRADTRPRARASRARRARRAPAPPPRRARSGGRRRDGAGRCIPGIVTKPPSGIAPIPYSMPLRFVLAIAGGKPT